MDQSFDFDNFSLGKLAFTAGIKPISAQNKNEDKLRFRAEVQKITSMSTYIITGTCWVSIDYYCRNINRLKNPGVYDIDNIVKPILDALVGQNGLMVDDVLVDRVIVNWIDTPMDDHFTVEIEYPDLYFLEKSNLIFIKSISGWCWPTLKSMLQDVKSLELIQYYFRLWDSIKTEAVYYDVLPNLPIQNFIYFGKIKDREYSFIELESLIS